MDSYPFYIELKSKNKVIGMISLKVNFDYMLGSTGSWLNEKYWRKGYMIEAKIIVHEFVFNKLKLRKMESSSNTTNVASNAALKKIGFKKEGLKIKNIISKATGKIHSKNIYGLLKEDWEKALPKLKKYK